MVLKLIKSIYVDFISVVEGLSEVIFADHDLLSTASVAVVRVWHRDKDFLTLIVYCEFLIHCWHVLYPGYYAWRNRERGSWYIEALVQIFMKYARCEDICTMLNRVGKRGIGHSWNYHGNIEIISHHVCVCMSRKKGC